MNSPFFSSLECVGHRRLYFVLLQNAVFTTLPLFIVQFFGISFSYTRACVLVDVLYFLFFIFSDSTEMLLWLSKLGQIIQNMVHLLFGAWDFVSLMVMLCVKGISYRLVCRFYRKQSRGNGTAITTSATQF